MNRQLTCAEEYQLKLIYAAVFTVLGFEKEEVAQLQRTILGGIRSMPFQEAIAGHGGSGSVKYGDRYPPLSKCITAFKTSLGSVSIDVARDWWLWLGRDSHDKLLLRYSRQFGSTIKICSCIGFAIRWQTQFNGRQVLERGESYFASKDPEYLNVLKAEKATLIGLDRKNRPTFLLRCKLHSPKAQSRDTLRRLCVMLFETGNICQNKDIDGCSLIYDLRDWTTRNKDPALLKFVLQNMSKVFPCICAQLIFHMAGPTFKAMLKVVTLGLDTANKAKIKFTNSLDELLEYVALDQLPRHVGGASTIGDIGWIPPREEDDACMKDRETHDSLQAERAELLDKFNEGIVKWIDGDPFKERAEILGKIHDNFWKLDPYVRSRTIWDRQGVVGLCRPDLVKSSTDDVYDITYWNKIASGDTGSVDESGFDQLTNYTSQSLQEEEINFFSQDPLAQGIADPRQIPDQLSEELQPPMQAPMQESMQPPLRLQSPLQEPLKQTRQPPRMQVSLPKRIDQSPELISIPPRTGCYEMTGGYSYINSYDTMYTNQCSGTGPVMVPAPIHQMQLMEGDQHSQIHYHHHHPPPPPHHQPIPEEYLTYQEFIRSGQYDPHQ